MKAKICPICNEIYADIEKTCPNCGYQEPLNHDVALRYALCVVCIVVVLLSCLKIFAQKFNNEIADSYANDIEQSLEFYNKKDDFEVKRIYLNSMTNLSGLSKAQILKYRKRVVRASSIFSNIKNYSPNLNVYQIEDNLPWISAYEIVKNGSESENLAIGPSRHSMMINNPEILLGYIIPDYNFQNNKNEPNDVDYFFPKKVTWDEKNKTIRVYFNYKDFVKKHGYSRITFYSDDTNARDLGYNWIYCDKKQGATFKSANNISKNPYQMQGYYHRGYSCGLPSGCNNYSPMQTYMIFEVNSLNAVLKFKLWKNKPIISSQKADINYEMYFE